MTTVHGRLWGLDNLRALAILLVMYRHVAANYEQLALPVAPWGLDFGHLGVSLFCGVSGYLALGGSRPHGAWLWSKARRIYPALWMTTLAAAAGALVTGYKPVSTLALAAQFLGLGYFLPNEQRLSVAVWFITLILFCYLLALIARMAGQGALLVWGLAALIIASLWLGQTHVMLRHSASFCLGMGLFVLVRDGGLKKWGGAAVALVWIAAPMVPLSRFAAVATLLLWLTLSFPVARVNRGVGWLSDASYEIFLVHGLVLVAVARVLRLDPALGLPLFALISAVAAVILKWLSGRVIARLP